MKLTARFFKDFTRMTSGVLDFLILRKRDSRAQADNGFRAGSAGSRQEDYQAGENDQTN